MQAAKPEERADELQQAQEIRALLVAADEQARRFESHATVRSTTQP